MDGQTEGIPLVTGIFLPKMTQTTMLTPSRTCLGRGGHRPEAMARQKGYTKLADYLRSVIDAGGYAAHEAAVQAEAELKAEKEKGAMEARLLPLFSHRTGRDEDENAVLTTSSSRGAGHGAAWRATRW